MLSTEFIRNTSHPRDLIQDSERDPITLTAGMTDRRSYLGWARWLERGGLHDEVIERERRLAELKTAETLDELTALAQQTRIRWYLMHPGDAVGWPAEFLARPAFASGDFRVYQLPSGGRSR
jgi:hypothetical protein